MSALLDIASGLVLGLPLWIIGVHVFDAFHWVLHLLMRSRSRPIRALATPHFFHHRWLDRELTICWEYQHRNLWGHIVLEYATQLVFSALLLLVLPAPMVVGCVVYQTLLFSYILSQKGLDVAHHPIEMLDAYRPSFLAVPAYHALHHVYPDAHFSAYSKLIDYLVGGGTYLRRRFLVVGGDSSFGNALVAGLERAGALSIDRFPGTAPDAGRLAEADVLVICDPDTDKAAWTEYFIEATRERQLPPEVWAVQTRVDDGVARHYYGDRRVNYRAVRIDAGASSDSAVASRAAQRALFWIRRGCNSVPTTGWLGALGEHRRFRRVRPEAPHAVDPKKRRIEYRQVA